jgi:iron complex outermembrane receptor protein
MNNVFNLFRGRVTALAGFRYLKADTAQKNLLVPGVKTSNDSATAQSYGLSWRVLPKLSTFVSYSESFNPQLLNFDFEGNLLPPVLGKGYDYGIKFDLMGGRLSGSVAGYHITRSNALTPDPLHHGFNIAEGESVSDGAEVGLTLRPTDSWQIVASYANTNAKITKSTRATDIGLRSSNVPKDQGSMWNKYSIRQGSLKGLSAGVGVIRVATRRGNSALADLPALELPQYTRIDANLTYERKIRRKTWVFTFLVDNLTNEEYLPSFYGYADPRAYVGKVGFRF